MPFQSPARLVACLGATQVIGYGTTYYGFAQLARDVASTFGWPESALFGLFSLALLVGSLLAPAAGRWMDTRGAAPVMACGSGAVGVALAVMALAPGPLVFAAALIGLQMAAVLVLYEAAFTALVQGGGVAARTRIVHLTLIAGFASTLFWPLTGWLGAAFGWRGAFGVFAALNIAVALPLHLLLARAGRAVARQAAGAATAPMPDAAPSVRPDRRLMLLVTVGFALATVVMSALLAQMVPMLQMLGLGGSAVAVAALFGPAQVGVRFLNLVIGAGRHPIVPTLVAAMALPLAVIMLALTAPQVAGAALFVVLLGFGSGLKSIVQGTLPLALFGGAGYGARLGRMAAVRQIAGAVAPFGFAAALERFGAEAALTGLALIGAVAVATFVVVARTRPPA